MRIRVINGTPLHGVSLCDTCVNAKMRRGARLSDGWNGCEEFPGRIAQPVVECNQYSDIRMRLPMELTKQAFRYVPSLQRFLAPDEWEKARQKNQLAAADY